ncbi:MAG: Holliday junction branch migration protein RuvA [Gammaproteobacteria bacterium]|nr:Holliday junction branch migration protein RuvA [Gammaproteobacteria bacterium]
MIGSLRGTLAHKEPPFLVVEVGGVGYEVEAPMSTCFRLPATGQNVQLLTHLLVREDHHTLFGFWTDAERRLFRHLLKVSGVGAKTALGVLSGMNVEAFIRAVESDDVASLIRLPGIGRKTAERIVIEMRDRVRHPGLAGGRSGDGDGPASIAPRDEALDALIALGYKAPEARRMLDRVPETVTSTEELLRAVLRSAAPTKS